MIQNFFLRRPSKLTTAVFSLQSICASADAILRRYPPFMITRPTTSRSSENVLRDENSVPASRITGLTRLETVVDGCDYEHWLVVMETPLGYPSREEIVHGYVSALAAVLGSEEAAKNSIYSVSTKYYYAFGCKVQENLAHKIRCLPNVRWVLADSYLNLGEDDYGGEPVIDGNVVPYSDEYHADWLQDTRGDKFRDGFGLVKATRK
ncbi:hypothetical protein Ancab_012614 [Ancistrocladus abbreviatus]